MRDLIVRRPQQRTLTFDRRERWQTLHERDQCQCKELVGQLLRAVLQARSEDERENPSRSSERAAYVYVRQSSLQQVRHHREGQQRQYGLADRARQVGFTRVFVTDDDLGVSGTERQKRPGFGRLLTAVCEVTVGAVFAFEASRLARNNRDWHHLIDRMTDTILVDDDEICPARLTPSSCTHSIALRSNCLRP
jgi:hypothetical protein